jgi:hypothetical protein
MAAVIESLQEAEESRLRECATQAAEDYVDSVLAIYRSSDASEGHPEQIGSCILLEIDGTPLVVTAAHIVDDITKGATLFVAGSSQSQLVPIMGGDIKATSPPRGDRDQDHADSAFWRIPDDVANRLGAANFLGTSRLSHNRAPLERRYYTAFGYPVCNNEGRVNRERRTISFAPSMHTSNAVSEPKLARKLRSTEDQHIFVRFAKQSQNAHGETVETFYPKGLSGGALLDLGDFTSPDIYQGDPKLRARLAGVIIEYHDKQYRTLVAVKINPIVSGIRNA